MKLRYSLCLLLVPAIFLCGCSGARKTFRHADRWIPTNFNPEKTVLLVEKIGLKKPDKGMIAYMEKKYPYRFEVTSGDSIREKSGKYADTDLYRFALVNSTTSSQVDFNRMGGGGASITGFDFNFYDRKLGKNYPRTRKASSFPLSTFRPVINTIVKKFKKDS